MTKSIGRKRVVGFGKETSRGTVAAISEWFERIDLTFENKSEKIEDESAIGVIERSQDRTLVKRWAEGDISGKLKVNSIGLLLLNLFGAVASAETAGGSAAYQHDFTVQNSNAHQSLTIGVNDDVQDLQFALAMLNTFSLAIELEQDVSITGSFRSKPSEDATLTPSFGTDYLLSAKHVTVKFADDLAGLGAAPAIDVRTVNIDFNKNLEDLMKLGDVNVNDICNNELMITGNLEVVFENETYKDYDLNNESKAMRITITDPNTNIGNATDNPTLELDFAKCTFDSWALDSSLESIQKETFGFEAHFSKADAKSVTAKLINTIASY